MRETVVGEVTEAGEHRLGDGQHHGNKYEPVIYVHGQSTQKLLFETVNQNLPI